MAEPLLEVGDLVREAPWLGRVGLGVAGLVLDLAGARIYDVALWLGGFVAGAMGGLMLVTAAAPFVPAIAAPPVPFVVAAVAGVALAVVVRLVHRVGVVVLGAVLGVAVGQAVAASFLPTAWWPAAAGLVVGAVAVPLAWKRLLSVITAAAGSLLVATAAGYPHDLRVVGVLFAVGVLAQGLGGRGRGEERR